MWYAAYLIKTAMGENPKALSNMLSQAVKSTLRFTRSGDPGKQYAAGARTSQKYLAPILERVVTQKHPPAWVADPNKVQQVVAPMMSALTPKYFAHGQNVARKIQRQQPGLSGDAMLGAMLPEINKVHGGTMGDLAKAERNLAKFTDTAEKFKMYPSAGDDSFGLFESRRSKLIQDLFDEFGRPYER